MRTALLSIRPVFADQILAGTKRVEFRRVRFARMVVSVAIYATQPVGAVVGWFTVRRLVTGTPYELWLPQPSPAASATTKS